MRRLLYVMVGCCLAVGSCAVAGAQTKRPSEPLKLVQTIEMPGVAGRIDHLALDAKGKRLFVSALGNHTVEVIDLNTAKVIHTITGLKEPQGILYSPASNLLFVADGELDTCRVYNASTYHLERSAKELPDADNIKLDQASANTYGADLVDVGYGSSKFAGVRALDSKNGRPVFDIPLDGHPESFVPSTTTEQMFVNIPSRGYIALASSNFRRVLGKWRVPGFRNFFPMAFDEEGHRLFVGSRTPPALVVLDSKTGKMIAHVDAVGDADDLFYDATNKRLYMSGGSGQIAVFAQRDANHYALLAKVNSAPGARTSLLVSDLHRFFVAAPAYQGKPARILIYELEP